MGLSYFPPVVPLVVTGSMEPLEIFHRIRTPSFHHIAQALQGHSLHVFDCPPLYQHALVPSSFRI